MAKYLYLKGDQSSDFDEAILVVLERCCSRQFCAKFYKEGNIVDFMSPYWWDHMSASEHDAMSSTQVFAFTHEIALRQLIAALGSALSSDEIARLWAQFYEQHPEAPGAKDWGLATDPIDVRKELEQLKARVLEPAEK